MLAVGRDQSGKIGQHHSFGLVGTASAQLNPGSPKLRFIGQRQEPPPGLIINTREDTVTSNLQFI
jgi:hypothetical protein